MDRYEYRTMNEIADEVIEQLQTTANPFDTPTVVFHNTKIAQWFKAYYLKKHSEVLMNVRFVTLSVFINDLINPNGEYHIIGRSEIKHYLIKVLLGKCSYDPANPENATNYIYDKKNGNINGINLYEFADKLSVLLMNYEYDSENMDQWTNGKWEKDIYDEVIRLAKEDNCYTTKSLFEMVRNLKKAKDSSVIESKTYIVDNSYITNLYNDILNEYDNSNVSIYTVNSKEEIYECEKIISAPSILREVEAVHSEICKIIHDNPGTRYNDILVYVPSIDNYTNTIHRVFKQDDKTYPLIPYRIVGACKEQQDMISSLRILFEIANNRFFTRKDFHSFVNNPMIKYLWNISDEEIASWMDVIDSTNTHRNGKEDNDWKYLKKRLLLSKLVSDNSDIENRTQICNEYFLPYQSIDVDFKSANKLIDIVDALIDWSDGFNDTLDNIQLSGTDIKKKTKLLDRLYSKKGVDGEETNYLYKTILDENETIVSMNILIPANTWMQLLLDSPSRYVSHPADMFTRGVTFMSLNSDDMVTEPYVFVMGLSSKDFPRITLKSEIDYSEKHIASEELDKQAVRNVATGAEHCICSYVSYDLKKDSEYYPSTNMPKLQSGKGVTQIPLDENRDYAELFTKTEFVNKTYYDSLVSGTTSSEENNAKRSMASIPENIDTVLKISDMKNYLENTFVYKYNHLLQKSDDKNGIILDAYEPIDASNLTRYSTAKELIESKLTDSKIKENMRLIKSLPENELGEIYYAEYKELAEKKKNIIINEGYQYKVLPPLELNTVKSGEQIKWTLQCNIDMYTKQNGNELSYIEPVLGSDKLKDCFNAYIYSLMDVAQNYDDGKEYHINAEGEKYSIKSIDAKEVLNKLYEQMTNYKDTRYMDSELLADIITEIKENNFDDSKKIPKTFKEFESKISKNSKWKYFDDNKMINARDAFGYDDNIKNQLKKMAEFMKPCIKFL